MSLYKPKGPSINVKIRYELTLTASAGGVVASAYNIGAVITSLSDFTDFAPSFGRFTISHAKLIVLPISGWTTAANYYRYPLAVGYVND